MPDHENTIWNIRYEVGNEHFRGKTIVELRDDYSICVTSVRNGETTTFESILPDNEAEAVYQIFVDNFYENKGKTPPLREPDEDLISIIYQKGHEKHTLITPYHTQWEDQKLKTLISLFSKLAKDVSKGRVTY